MKYYYYLIFAWSLLFGACASSASFTYVENEIINEKYSAGAEVMEKNKGKLYASKDTLLYHLDKGMLFHYAGQYSDSTELLQEAEREIEDAFTKSITQELSSYLVNDLTKEYSGEDYEDIYINIFNALNYYHRSDMEGSLVEIRRMNNKLQYLVQKYDAALSNLQKKAIDDGEAVVPSNPDALSKFNNSALARYLGILFYRSAGLEDDARIDREYLLAAFANAPDVYRHPVPKSVSDELENHDDLARLNVIAFSGLSPIKKEVVIRIPLLGNNRWIKIALPEMDSRNSNVGRAELVFADGTKHELELLEDIDAVAKETFKTKASLIYLKTIIRATAKAVSSVAMKEASRETGGEAGLALWALSAGTQAYSEVSERADTRMSRFFPGKAYIGGINLPPGNYSFEVNYYDAYGKIISTSSYNSMNISKNSLNLAEAFCLK